MFTYEHTASSNITRFIVLQIKSTMFFNFLDGRIFPKISISFGECSNTIEISKTNDANSTYIVGYCNENAKEPKAWV
ncbi:24900_t:CDS:2 [Gigaspora rosea]|nr:24900_t:CDS:2 [Gigaspora rosea]